MANELDSSQPVTIDVYEPGAGLDFSGFIHTEPDTGGPYLNLSTDNHFISSTGMPRSATCFFQSPPGMFPIGLDDFTLSFKVNASVLEQHGTSGFGGGHIALMLVELQTTTNQDASADSGDGIIFSYRAYNVNNQHLMQIRSRYGGSENYAEVDCPLGIDYDVTITRTGLQIIMSITTGGTTIWSNDTNPIEDNTDIKYLVPFCGRGDTDVPDQIATAVMWNYSLTTPIQGEDFLMYEHGIPGDTWLQVTTNNVSFTGMPRSAQAYLRKTATYGPQFNLRTKLTVDYLEPNTQPGYAGGFFGLFGFTRQTPSVTYQTMRWMGASDPGDGISLYAYAQTTDTGVYNYALWLRDNTRAATTEEVEYDGWIFATGTSPTWPFTFYLDIYRSNGGADFDVYVYADQEYTTLLKHLWIRGCDTSDFAYFLPAYSMGPDSGAETHTASGSVADYEFV